MRTVLQSYWIVAALVAFLASVDGIAPVEADSGPGAEIAALVSGSWIDALEDRRQCTGISASVDMVGAADIDLEVKGELVELNALEYRATYKLQRSRKTDWGVILELSGVGYGLGETTTLRSLWSVRENSRGETTLTKVEWEDSRTQEGQEFPEHVADPMPLMVSYLRCRK